MAQSYNHKRIEDKWNRIWQDSRGKESDVSSAGNKYYCLDMFPYPSGDGLHVGHWRGYVMSDFYTRHAKLQGKNVLHPMGFDSFGLPAENAAIKHKTHPEKFTQSSIKNFTKQLKQMGAMFDWSKVITTSSPEYYKWTQWLFLQLHKHGFVEKRKSLVHWCPTDQTVLANEQVVNGCCERCGTKVTKKELEQWYILTTKLAEELLEGLDNVDWPERVKNLQRNWIGRSAGAELCFRIQTKGVKRFILLHGKGGSPKKDFFPWLKASLEKEGYEVLVPSLPNTDNPNDKEQAEFVADSCKIDETTVVVGHSFGGIVAQRLLEQEHRVKGLVLVATPYTGDFIDGKDRPTVKKALEAGYDFELIKKNSTFTIALADKCDDIVDPNDLRSYADKLGGQFVVAKANSPHFNSLKEGSVLEACLPAINTFTTRPDTLFGVSAIVLAPEHPLAKKLAEKGGKRDEFNKYFKEVSSKTNIDRQQGKESDKTAVDLNVTATHPLTEKEVPVWVADYVLMDYGTGAVMSVPAHDERDFMFAKAHKLPMKTVIEPVTGIPLENEEFRRSIVAVVENPKNKKVISINWGDKMGGNLFIGGGIDEDEDLIGAAKREIQEETGYENVRFISKTETIHHHYVAHSKGVNRYIQAVGLYFELENGEKTKTNLEEDEKDKFKVEWLDKKTAERLVKDELHSLVFKRLVRKEIYSGYGILTNSYSYSEETSEEAADRIVADLEIAGLGKYTHTFRLRDWLVSRQRYWGAPIPIVYDPKGNPHPVKEEHLPIKLPEDVDFLPGGESPLARSNEYIELAERLYGKGWRFDTDTLDTFVDSSWYFLRYLTPNNNDNAFSRELVSKWLPVDLYIGGIEHATLHLMYARFVYKFLNRHDYIDDKNSEPFKKLFNIGMITLHGAKMSKSKGNIVSPDPLIEHYGTDALRGYEMFVGPLDADAEWSSRGINGIHRFLIKVNQLSSSLSESSNPEKAFNSFLVEANKMIADYRLNTLMSEYMKFINSVEKTGINKELFGKFLVTLSPIFPYLAEELWSKLGNTDSIFNERWPVQKKMDSNKTIPLMINQKFVMNVEDPGAEDKVKSLLDANEAVSKKIAGKKYRTVYKPGSIINVITS